MRRKRRRRRTRRCACLLIHAAICVYFHSPPVFVLLFSQHALQVRSNQPRARVCVYSAPPTAARQLRPPPSACAATATIAATPISRTSPAPVSLTHITSLSPRAFAGFLWRSSFCLSTSLLFFPLCRRTTPEVLITWHGTAKL